MLLEGFKIYKMLAVEVRCVPLAEGRYRDKRWICKFNTNR